MHYCNDCKQYAAAGFDFDKSIKVCLHCGSEKIEGASECRICKQPIRGSEEYCPDCKEFAMTQIYEMADMLETTKEQAKDLILAVVESEDWNG